METLVLILSYPIPSAIPIWLLLFIAGMLSNRPER